MRPADVVVLSKFPEIFKGFKEAVDVDAPELHKIVVWDNSESLFTLGLGPPWEEANVVRPFQIAFNATHGWLQASSEADIFYVGDDVRFVQPNTIREMQICLEAFPDIGILSARIIGEDDGKIGVSVTPAPYVPFVCVLIRREVVEKIGFLDQRYEGYGVEDIDYCYSARKAGFKVAYSNVVHVKHGVDGHKWGSTFKRQITEPQRQAQDAANWQRFRDKYGIANENQMWELIRK